ncbi:GGDEF domain-containing protein [Sphingobium tyrosinilyticum]|uniref:GGDEF domain-containing protein n=1 Tax=Sphingobium tyrosinilyticum TaxID=2715436 RepID=UPI0036D38824
MNRHLPGGRLAAQLDALSREEVWLAIVTGTAIVAFLDYSLPAAGLAPVYIVMICGACWGLGAREGYLVAASAALLSVASAIRYGIIANSEMAMMQVGIRVLPLLFLAATVTSFRRSYDRERFLARHDPMTHMLNKEVFKRCARNMIEDAARAGHILLLLVFDLDDFKAVNSRGGHQAGDEVIGRFADALLAARRSDGLVGRVGGDEFSYLTRVTSAQEASNVANSLHAHLTAVLADGRHPVTCSIGALLIAPERRQDFQRLMHAADLAMYQAKSGGKDSVQLLHAGRCGENSGRSRHGGLVRGEL